MAKKIVLILFILMTFIFIMCACGKSANSYTTKKETEATRSGSYKSSYYDGDSYSGSSYKSNGTGEGGYEMPNEGDKSFADYVKRVDPDLYDNMNDAYDSLK